MPSSTSTMKIALWLYMLALWLASYALWIVLSVAENILLRQLQGKPLPHLTELVFACRTFLLWLPLPWAFAAGWFTRRSEVRPDAYVIFTASVLLVACGVFAAVILACALACNPGSIYASKLYP